MIDPAPNVHFDNRYAALPERFYARLSPQPVAAPATIRVNHPLAEQLGFDPRWLESEEGAQVVVGNRLLEGSTPIAMAYGGHQFGNWNPGLGDGRAILLGEVIGADGGRYDVHLKGSGRTPYSRMGDGRAPLGPVLREYLVSEAMFALGIPTTRSLAVAATGEPVQRERVLPGGILVRVARSHIRVGTFQYFAARRDVEALRVLVDHAVWRHLPEAGEARSPALELLRAVVRRQAELVAQWQLVGFIHGVMNTDNMLVSGETIDYGPCAFMDAYDPMAVFSSIDRGGRYAYGNQPRAAHFNLVCLARALLPVIDEQEPERGLRAAQDAVDELDAFYERAFMRGMARKLGISELSEWDEPLVTELLDLMNENEADFTLTFRHLSDLAAPDETHTDPEASVSELFELPAAFEPWLARWRERCAQEEVTPAERQRRMRAANPALIPRNHLVDAALADAERQRDFKRFHALVNAMASPYEYRSPLATYARPPRPEERIRRTFCGT